MDVRAHIQHVLDAERRVLFAKLFGSRNKGMSRLDSDWDVAVYLDDSLSPAERFDLRLELTSSLNGPDRPPVDVLVLNDAPPLLCHRALQGTDLITRDRRAYVRFFIRTMKEADDDRHYQQVHIQERARRLKEGRFGRP